MSKSAYDRWLNFIAQPHSISGLTFPAHEARAIMAIPLTRDEPNWRRYKRQVNKVAKVARMSAHRPLLLEAKLVRRVLASEELLP